MSVVWVYALLCAAPRESLGTGLAGEPLRLLTAGPVLAVTGTLGSLPAADATALERHAAVVQRIACAVDAVLPLRFGAAAMDEATLIGLLDARAEDLRDALALVSGREQMTLRVYGDPQGSAEYPAVTLMEVPASLPADPLAPRSAPPSPHPTLPPGSPPVASAPAAPMPPVAPGSAMKHGGRYMTARLVARANAQAVPEIEPLRGSLAAFVRAERVEHHVLPPLLASVFHLVERGQGAQYATAVEAAARGLGAVRVAATGPHPPYAFAPESLGLHALGQ